MSYMETLGRNAKESAPILAAASTKLKNDALEKIANALISSTDKILEANAKDLEAAAENNMKQSMQDRLRLSEERIKGIAKGVRELIAMEDPVGKVESGSIRPNGLQILKTKVPLGVIGMIFESRPNVTVDAAVLCLKSGNAVILRGGKEAINSSICLAKIMREAVKSAGLPENCIQLVEDTSREIASEMMKLTDYIDVLIPRGGAGLIHAVCEQAKVPVIQTGVGNCHLYVDDSADIEMAVSITDNAKTQRPSVCNAIETLLVHKDIAEKFLPEIKKAFDKHDVVIYGCPETKRILGECVFDAGDEEYRTEFNDYKIAVKVVENIDEAIAHIRKYGTQHSECIVTSSVAASQKFQKEVDASTVYVNASTRFTDGGEFGLGAEIGISTQKLHTRGPMGLDALTTVKYLVTGNGQIRQ